MTDNPTPTPSTLGAFVRQARERAGLSLRNLEAIVGVSRQLLLRLEHDQLDNPSPTLLNQPDVQVLLKGGFQAQRAYSLQKRLRQA